MDEDVRRTFDLGARRMAAGRSRSLESASHGHSRDKGELRATYRTLIVLFMNSSARGRPARADPDRGASSGGDTLLVE